VRRYLILFRGKGCVGSSTGLYTGRNTQSIVGGEWRGQRGCTLFESIGAARHAINDDWERRKDWDEKLIADDYQLVAVTVEMPGADALPKATR
jgi:hypothetical protein